MTLIAIVRERNKIYCYSDTRVSQREVRIVDYFSKQFRINVQCTSGGTGDSPKHAWRNELGFALVGSTVFGLSLAAQLNEVCSNLHSQTSDKPVTFDQLHIILKRCADLIFDQIVINRPDMRKFQALLFGYCPVEKGPGLCIVQSDPGNDHLTTNSGFLPIHENALQAFGSGKAALHTAIEELKQQGYDPNLGQAFERAILSGLDKGTGGGIQVGIAAQGSYRLKPVALKMIDRQYPDVTLGALNVTDFGSIGEFSIGRDLHLISR